MARRRHHRRHARHNPTHMTRRTRRESPVEHGVRNGLMFLGASIVGVFAAVAADAGLGMTQLSPAWKAVLKTTGGFAGLAGGTIASMKSRVGGAALLGAGLGLTFDGLLDGYNLTLAPYVARAMAPAPSATPPITSGTTAPGGGVMLPAGAPASFRAYAPNSCAV